MSFLHPNSLICGSENTTLLNTGAEICLWTGGVNLVELTLLGCEIAQFILSFFFLSLFAKSFAQKKGP